jgi:hypothetical protein
MIGCAGLDYFIDVTIGVASVDALAKGQSNIYRLILDSGSTTMAVAGYDCTNCFTKTSPPYVL